ncbi:Ubiquitin-conjugating enzyme E2-17 kDa [Orchesella cincta]|uniref:Ubiquitin-conjugating enzyme E2-17 kDa n=1 Tax=Orchesella cincta TaxID=48709 RepID=A0A1D2MLH8_ORCCI|nr:Ubiquitin-conjugating enzyme E2-17 kDa [Orchesella cincta]
MERKKAMKKIQADLKQINENPPAGVSVGIDSDNMFFWNATIFGPEDTPFEGGIFRLRIEFPFNYPLTPPRIWFYSRMFHPNVYSNGRICLDILEDEDKWEPSYDAAGILCAIQSMLGDPNPESPANGEANELYLKNRAAYEKRVKQIVQMSMSDPDEQSSVKNLNAEDEEELINARLEELDLRRLQGTPEQLREFFRNIQQ